MKLKKLFCVLVSFVLLLGFVPDFSSVAEAANKVVRIKIYGTNVNGGSFNGPTYNSPNYIEVEVPYYSNNSYKIPTPEEVGFSDYGKLDYVYVTSISSGQYQPGSTALIHSSGATLVYYFSGNGGGESGGGIIPDGPQTGNYTFWLKYNPNGGIGEEVTYQYKNYASIRNTEVKTNMFSPQPGFVFTGWKDSQGNSYSEKGNILLQANTTAVLYAQWKPVTENDKVDLIVETEINGEVTDTEYKYDQTPNSSVNISPKITKEDGYTYTFEGWELVSGTGDFQDRTKEETTFTLGKENAIVKAKYEKTKKEETVYEISYDKGKGEGTAPESQTVEKGKEVKLSQPTNLVPPTGQIFDQWEDQNGKRYDAGATIVPEGNLQLTAIYKDQPVTTYTVTYDKGKGEGTAPESQTVEKGKEVKLSQPANLVPPTGQIFDQWEDQNGKRYDAGATIVPEGNLQLTAIYKDQPVTTYTVIYDKGKGEGTAPAKQVVEAGKSIIVVAPTTIIPPAGKEFIGWESNGKLYKPGEVLTPIGDMTLTAVFEQKSTPPSPPVVIEKHNVIYDLNGGDGQTPTESPKSPGEQFKAADLTNIIVPEGKEFKYWATEKDGSGQHYNPGDLVTMPKSDLTLYAIWTDKSGQQPELNKKDHIAYVVGFKDGSFRPEKSVTRGEVAAIFARLIAEKMNMNQVYPSTFKDVKQEKWYSDYIGYLEKYKIISGYSDGTFRPEAPITRAEFTVIASRFSKVEAKAEKIFTDVPADHWASAYISTAYKNGWINGYADGTFKPEQQINRAEAVKIVNSMLDRIINEDSIKGTNVKDYTDVKKNHWAYYHITEASNAHDYIKEDNQEIWVEVK
ncbi:S-layer homology domain-containing protein [Bacillus testis]|uniref:S-layer homology domain-containing protein n=1 Tax=Bacillus testis TaxID=1622072 RepID=UPI00067F23EB|nr:S-layer homology domain-containing protein [Bacillus testis]